MCIEDHWRFYAISGQNFYYMDPFDYGDDTEEKVSFYSTYTYMYILKLVLDILNIYLNNQCLKCDLFD